MRKRLASSLAVAGLFLLLAVPAGLAAGTSPTKQGYHKPTQPKPAVVHKTKQPVNTSKKSGVLPFTGMDLTLMAAGAILLVLVGGGLRILVRKS